MRHFLVRWWFTGLTILVLVAWQVTFALWPGRGSDVGTWLALHIFLMPVWYLGFRTARLHPPFKSFDAGVAWFHVLVLYAVCCGSMAYEAWRTWPRERLEGTDLIFLYPLTFIAWLLMAGCCYSISSICEWFGETKE